MGVAGLIKCETNKVQPSTENDLHIGDVNFSNSYKIITYILPPSNDNSETYADDEQDESKRNLKRSTYETGHSYGAGYNNGYKLGSGYSSGLSLTTGSGLGTRYASGLGYQTTGYGPELGIGSGLGIASGLNSINAMGMAPIGLYPTTVVTGLPGYLTDKVATYTSSGYEYSPYPRTNYFYGYQYPYSTYSY